MKKRIALALLLCFLQIVGIISPAMVDVRASSDSVSIVKDGKVVNELEISRTEKKTLTAEYTGKYNNVDYQWQLLSKDNEWVGIYDRDGKKCEVSYSLVKNMLDSAKSVYIRCKVSFGEEEFISNIVSVTIIKEKDDTNKDEEPVKMKLLKEGYAEEATITPPDEVVVDNVEEIEEDSTSKEESEVEDSEEGILEEDSLSEEFEEVDSEEGVAEVSEEVEERVEEKAEEVPVKEAPSTLSLRQSEAPSNASTVADEYVTITIKYLDIASLSTGVESSIYSPYTAVLEKGSGFDQTVVSPTFIGFAPYFDADDDGEVDDDASTIILRYGGLVEDVTIYVYYKPAIVDFAIKYFFQNINDDMYTEDVSRYHRGKAETGSFITDEYLSENAGDTTGFEKLYHYPESVAANGSTVFECYYDRNYYLLTFDLDGGYGVDPIYARYDTPFVITNPIKHGYIFKGWDLVDSSGNGDGIADELPSSIQAQNLRYKALWGREKTSFTVVYWKENADDTDYTYWGSKTVTGIESASVVNGKDYKSVSFDDASYFTYSHADEEVVVEGDGTTVVNVYYSRNTYTLKFDITSYKDTFTMENTHTHDDGTCDGVSCDAHIHDESCGFTVVCGKSEHEHSDSCYSDCNKEEHKHSMTCCTLDAHTHSTSCYKLSTGTWGSAYNGTPSGTTASNGVVRANNKYYYKIGDTWYQISGLSNRSSSSNYYGKVVVTECTLNEHNHGTGCVFCSKEEHTHGSSCATCGSEAHTHTDSCKEFSCGFETHKHVNECYGKCSKVANYITTESGKTYYVIEAKYEQTIGLQWPTAACFEHKFYGWSIENSSSTQVSKIVNMVDNMCDTSDGVKYATEATSSNLQKSHLCYMFESFDQTSPEDGVNRKKYNNVYYDLDTVYYQQLNTGSSSFGYKGILGMTAASSSSASATTIDGERYFFLYYNREDYNLQFFNSAGYIKYDDGWETVSETNSKTTLQYGASLASYGELPDPPYPETLEENAYKFAGWYTTSECYAGSEFDFSTSTMPATDVIAYAKWEPVVHTVNFFTTYDEMLLYNKQVEEGKEVTVTPHESFEIEHGKTVGGASTPTIENTGNLILTFSGWFYIEDGTKKAISLLDMPITKDMAIFADWSSNSPQPYKLRYVLQGTDTKVASDTTGFAYGGSTRTFSAKVGDPFNQLYPEYNQGYFPIVASHSITMQYEENVDNPVNNVYSFEYVEATNIEYTVKYVNKETNTVMEQKTGYTNKGVITEKFKAFENMVPDAFYKRLILSVEYNPDTGRYEGTDENELIFYYSSNSTSAFYAVHYMLERKNVTDSDRNNYAIDGSGGYEESTAHTEGIGDIGNTVSINPQTFSGFTLLEDKAVLLIDGNQSNCPLTGNKYGIEVTENGTELYLFYERNEYDYSVHYYKYNTNELVSDEFPSETGKAKYESVLEKSYKEIPGYTCVSDKTQSITVLNKSEQNQIIFYYSPSQYVSEYIPVSEDGGARLTSTIEVVTGNDVFSGSKPIENDYYEFAGWYLDENCTISAEEYGTIDDSTGEFIPDKGKLSTEHSNLFYAKFICKTTDLTIKKSGSADDTQVYVYDIVDNATNEVVMSVSVKGNSSTVVKGVPQGVYTIKQVNDWSWRYGDDAQIVNLSNVLQKTVEFNEGVNNSYWLHGNSPIVRNIRGTN